NHHDDHNLYGGTQDMRLICVFNPPIKGTENHDSKGVYPFEE
ncbi:MAG: ectoine synthase, partial [Arcobacteraceae bacterium]